MTDFKASVSGVSLTAVEETCLSALQARSHTVITELREWSEINSGSWNPEGLAKMRAVIMQAFKSLPGEIEEVPLEKGRRLSPKGEELVIDYQPSIRLTVRPEAEIQIVLTGHYDTVFPKDSHFQKTADLGHDKLGGPGVADMKGGILVMREALKAFEASPNAKRLGYTVLLSPDEETGSHGSAPLLAELGAKAHVGLTYEPSMADGSLAGARKGSGNFTVMMTGKAAHAGREPHLGRNAIIAMARFAVGLDALNGHREGVTFNLSKIDGGGAVNIVPDLAIGRFNVRLERTEDIVWIRREFQRLIDQANATEGISAELTGDFTRPPKPMAPANALVFDWVKRAGLFLGQEMKWVKSGGVCEGNNLWAAGCANVDTLGVIGGHIHSDREYMLMSSLAKRAQLSTLILMKMADDTFDAIKAKHMAQNKEKTC